MLLSDADRTRGLLQVVFIPYIRNRLEELYQKMAETDGERPDEVLYIYIYIYIYIYLGSSAAGGRRGRSSNIVSGFLSLCNWKNNI